MRRVSLDRVDARCRGAQVEISAQARFEQLEPCSTLTLLCISTAAGELIGAFGLTEPNHGSDPGGMETRAKKGWADSSVAGDSLQHFVL